MYFDLNRYIGSIYTRTFSDPGIERIWTFQQNHSNGNIFDSPDDYTYGFV